MQKERAAYAEDKAALNLILSNCTRLRTGQPQIVWGLYPSRITQKVAFWKKWAEKPDMTGGKQLPAGKSAHGKQAFQPEGFERQYWFTGGLTAAGISPSHGPHSGTAAYRADADVNIPDRFQQLRYGEASIFLTEPLVPLQGKNKLQVLCPHAVV